jgi:hypothetical protein
MSERVFCKNCGVEGVVHMFWGDCDKGDTFTASGGNEEIDALRKELAKRKGCDHLDAPYRELLKKNADLESLLFIANGQIEMAEERREEQNLKWGKEADELRRQLRNAQDRLTCGTHPGLSCLEVHTSDRDSMARLTRANHYLSDYIEELEEKKRGNK